MRVQNLVIAALLLVAAACTDDKPAKSGLVTAPLRPALTMTTLPKDASTVCVASVRQRDALLANPKTTSDSPDLSALSAVIDDVCQ
jgi:hypothetical protein